LSSITRSQVKSSEAERNRVYTQKDGTDGLLHAKL
jgi:hypothetical protein